MEIAVLRLIPQQELLDHPQEKFGSSWTRIITIFKILKAQLLLKMLSAK